MIYVDDVNMRIVEQVHEEDDDFYDPIFIINVDDSNVKQNNV